jgi:sulfur-oxidizing protein SoxX
MRSHATLSKLVVGLVGILGIVSIAAAADTAKPEMTGKQIAYDRSLGNCLACHAMPTQADVESPGTIGPPLIAMAARYPDKAKLRAQIWNAMDANPQTVMPPIGKNKILTEDEINKVTDFVYGL